MEGNYFRVSYSLWYPDGSASGLFIPSALHKIIGR